MKVTQSCSSLCDPTECSLPGSSVHEIPSQNTGVSIRSLLQGIFLTQGLNPGLPRLQVDFFYGLSHQGSPGKSNSVNSGLNAYRANTVKVEFILLFPLYNSKHSSTAPFSFSKKNMLITEHNPYFLSFPIFKYGTSIHLTA